MANISTDLESNSAVPEMSSGLEYILDGGPIEEFNSLGLPTFRDVLRLYSQYWRVNVSDGVKESRVANVLKNFYNERRINTVHARTIASKIRKSVLSLKSILKFKSKEKTQKNIAMENNFRLELSKLFEIEKVAESPSTSSGMESMEIDNNDIIFPHSGKP